MKILQNATALVLDFLQCHLFLKFLRAVCLSFEHLFKLIFRNNILFQKKEMGPSIDPETGMRMSQWIPLKAALAKVFSGAEGDGHKKELSGIEKLNEPEMKEKISRALEKRISTKQQHIASAGAAGSNRNSASSVRSSVLSNRNDQPEKSSLKKKRMSTPAPQSGRRSSLDAPGGEQRNSAPSLPSTGPKFETHEDVRTTIHVNDDIEGHHHDQSSSEEDEK